jgi:hypothetical protein
MRKGARYLMIQKKKMIGIMSYRIQNIQARSLRSLVASRRINRSLVDRMDKSPPTSFLHLPYFSFFLQCHPLYLPDNTVVT